MAFQVRRRRGCRALYVLVLAVVSLSASALSHAAALDQQRALFRKAVVDARDGRLDEARDAMMALEDYALVPYLDLELFKAQIYDLSATTADSYLGRHQNTAVGLFMHRAWLSKLQQNREWEEFLAFTKGVAPRGMRCEYIAALRSTGRHAEADAETQSLWLTGNSLPDRCDTVLANWLPRLAPADNEDLHKRRASLAIRSGQSSLAEYLLRRVPDTEQYRDLLVHPERLFQLGFQLETNDFNRELVLHTLKRLAESDFESGNNLWHQLSRRFQFTAQQNFGVRDSFARQGIAGGESFIRDWLSANDRNFEDPYLTEWRVRLALKEQDWKSAQYFIQALPQRLRDKSDWQYWWARADIESHQTMTPEAKAILEQMASNRGYYSFLAADMLNQAYQLGSVRTIKHELVEIVAQNENVQRAKELYWHGLVRNADREWRAAIRSFSKAEQVAAAQLALNWGWSNASVVTAIRAGEWDDLELRFPLAFHDAFESNAKASSIDLSWAYAIARQESAFAQDAQSRVGARGVMQLMPATADDIARQMGRPSPSLKDLHTPTVNIEMGSFYLGKLQEKFGGNHILATAAYNAGPSRIKRVLARQHGAMPADIWIENLPYGETREYIKNVLAFSVVYGMKLNSCKTPSVHEGCDGSKKNRYSVIEPAPVTEALENSGS